MYKVIAGVIALAFICRRNRTILRFQNINHQEMVFIMFLFRVMNEFDMTIDPIKNGLASKELIYNATKNIYIMLIGKQWRNYL